MMQINRPKRRILNVNMLNRPLLITSLLENRIFTTNELKHDENLFMIFKTLRLHELTMGYYQQPLPIIYRQPRRKRNESSLFKPQNRKSTRKGLKNLFKTLRSFYFTNDKYIHSFHTRLAANISVGTIASPVHEYKVFSPVRASSFLSYPPSAPNDVIESGNLMRSIR